MSHEIDELAPGIHAAAFANTDAWHKLGQTVDHNMTALEVMTEAHLAGWNVRKRPLFTSSNGEMIELDDKYATVRTNPVTDVVEPLGVVGSQYTPIQNESHVDLLDAIVDESGAHFETAGSLKGGREVFITMRMPDSIKVGGTDQVDLYLAALNSHDGSSAFRFLVTPVRIVCANTQAAAIKQARASFSIRHSSGANGRLQEAREALGLTFKYTAAFAEEAEAMYAQPYDTESFRDTLEYLYGIPAKRESGASVARLEGHVDRIVSIWRDAPTMTGITGTKWGAYQAVTEYLDHYAPVRSAKDRALRVVSSYGVPHFKERAFMALSA